MKSNLIKSLIICGLTVAFLSCEAEKKKRVLNFPKTDLAKESMIPMPMKVISTEGGFA
ncbi:MAG: beta-N-acetylhexosaminidase, partial [Pricia sp.]|nr:beta-N-acetylhexosaminidase [Pricia sp.]